MRIAWTAWLRGARFHTMKSVFSAFTLAASSAVPGYSTEVAPSSTITKDGNFEIREYPELVLAETPQSANGSNSSFGRLFGYISGANESGKKIPMTAPVFMDGHSAEGRMAFILPTDLPLASAPAARDGSVKIRAEAGGFFAVLRFGGFATSGNEKRAVEELRRIIGARKLEPTGEPFFAYYDPPWTIPPFRRNEVLVRLRALPGL